MAYYVEKCDEQTDSWTNTHEDFIELFDAAKNAYLTSKP